MKPVAAVAVGVFALVAVVHVLRIVFATPVTVGTTSVPMWVSVVGAGVAAVLAVMLAREGRRRG